MNMMSYDLLASALGTTRGRLWLGVAGATGIITATALYVALKAYGMRGVDAASYLMMGWWVGTVLLGPLCYDLVSKGWSLDHHAERGR